MSEAKVEWWVGAASVEIEAISDALYGSAPMIEGIIARHVPDPESQPITRGDVVQVVGGEMIGLTGVVVDPDGRLLVFEFRSFDNKFKSRITGAKVEPSNLVRIGRARYYPDGTPVELAGAALEAKAEP